MSTLAERVTARRSPAQLFALTSAVIYLIAGLAGFAVTGFEPFVGLTGDRLIILGLNPLHNIVHLTLGATWLWAARDHRTSALTNAVLGAGLLVAFVVGMAGAGQFLNIVGPSEPDNYLHLIWGALSLYLGTAGAEGAGAGRRA